MNERDYYERAGRHYVETEVGRPLIAPWVGVLLWISVPVMLIGVSLFLLGTVARVIHVGVNITEKSMNGPADTVLTKFLHAMDVGNLDFACSLVSEASPITCPLLEEWYSGTSYVSFQGFESVWLDQWRTTRHYDFNPDYRWAMIELEGYITYEGDYKSTFEARFREEDDTWRLLELSITVSVEKYHDFIRSQPDPAEPGVQPDPSADTA